jgi:hypothetical protein
MRFETFAQMINSKMASESFTKSQQRIENEMQSLLIGLLTRRHVDNGIVITSNSALRHVYGLPRFNASNVISFKTSKPLNIKEFEALVSDLNQDATIYLDVKCEHQVAREKKSRRIDGSFYVPNRLARLTINKTPFYIAYDSHTVYDEQSLKYLDELNMGIIKSELPCESLDVVLCEKVASLLGESTFDGEAMFDVVWMINKGAVIEPDVMENIVDDHNISNIQLNMMSLANRSSSTSLQRELFQVDTINAFNLLDAPTENIAFFRISQIFKDSLVEISPVFGEQHEVVRNRKAGISTEESNILDGKDIKGAGLKASQTLRPRSFN